MNKLDLVTDLWVGLNGGYITKDEYTDMLELQNLDDVCPNFIECSSSLDKEMALESENIEF